MWHLLIIGCWADSCSSCLAYSCLFFICDASSLFSFAIWCLLNFLTWACLLFCCQYLLIGFFCLLFLFRLKADYNYAGACFFFLCRFLSYFVMQILFMIFVLMLACFLGVNACLFSLCWCSLFFSRADDASLILLCKILVYDFCADACFLSWYQCLIIILVLMLACFLVLILAWFSCADSLFF